MDVAFQREAHQPPPGIVDRTRYGLLPAPTLLAVLAGHGLKNPVRLIPRFAFARCDDWAHRDIEADGSPKGCRPGTKLAHTLTRRRQRFSIDRVHIATPRAHLQRAVGGAAEKQQRMRLLQRAYV